MRMFAALALVALPALALARPLTNTPQDTRPVPTVEEPSTDVEFPVRLTVVDKKTTHELAGMGVRVKKKFFMKFKVYAVGFYIDEKAALPVLRKSAADLSVKKLEDSKDFRKALLSDKFGKTVRLVMVRDVDADTMAEAFEDSLWPRMKARTKETKDRTAAKAALDKFRGFFEKEAEEDQVMDFTWVPGGKLYAVVDGKKFPVVQNEALCWALFDIYLGDDPISDDAKTNIFGALRAKLHPKK
jgi:hypothetical protein